jgi:Na+-transporting NADH:ubiquinone oxidoreductase subunit NqrC
MSNGEVQFTVKELVVQLHRRIDKVLEGQELIRVAVDRKIDRVEFEEIKVRVRTVESRQVSDETMKDFRNRMRRNGIALWSVIIAFVAILADAATRLLKK